MFQAARNIKGMAERIQDFSLPAHATGRSSLYPWHDWTDGTLWRIKRGEDFVVSVYSMARQLGVRAYSYDLRCERRTNQASGTIEFRFTPRDNTT